MQWHVSLPVASYWLACLTANADISHEAKQQQNLFPASFLRNIQCIALKKHLFTSSVYMTDRWRPPVQIMTSTKLLGCPLRKTPLTLASMCPHSIKTHLPMAVSIADMLRFLLCVAIWWKPCNTRPASLKPRTSMSRIRFIETDITVSMRSSRELMQSGSVSRKLPVRGLKKSGSTPRDFSMVLTPME